ncbi:MAG TPA: helix-turn-helix transcriptional regulator [Candidatus Saccharimonadia bacterium]|nr:helix-turn-helix transcriptional regulator [Candidatus Saccharimonadia bacterium]
MKDWKSYKEESLKNDPELAHLYDELEPEYQLARSFIEARIAKGLTQIELAQKAGVGQTVIARLESGTSNPTVATVSKVARVLGQEYRLVKA